MCCARAGAHAWQRPQSACGVLSGSSFGRELGPAAEDSAAHVLQGIVDKERPRTTKVGRAASPSTRLRHNRDKDKGTRRQAQVFLARSQVPGRQQACRYLIALAAIAELAKQQRHRKPAASSLIHASPYSFGNTATACELCHKSREAPEFRRPEPLAGRIFQPLWWSRWAPPCGAV